VFVGVEAYTEAGGTILRDLFTEDRGGYFEDVALLDLLVTAKLGPRAEWASGREGDSNSDRGTAKGAVRRKMTSGGDGQRPLAVD
jgi:hypothetical protein